jgi:hypothetical protein
VNRKASVSGFGLSAAICSLLNALLVLLKESNPGVKSLLEGLFDSHWLAHAVLILGLFILLGALLGALLPYGRRPGPVLLTRLLVTTTVLSTALIAGFFLLS